MKKLNMEGGGYASIRDTESERAAENVRNANETERHLSGQLVSLSILFLTVSVIAFSDSDALGGLNCATKVLISITFLVIVASIASGIKYYFVCNEYYLKSARVHHSNYEYMRDKLLLDEEVDLEVLNQNSKEQKFQADTLFLKTQIALLFLGALLCFALLTALLF